MKTEFLSIIDVNNTKHLINISSIINISRNNWSRTVIVLSNKDRIITNAKYEDIKKIIDATNIIIEVTNYEP